MSSIMITGANEGIGYFLAEQLLEDGHRVVVLDKETEHIQELQKTYPDALSIYLTDVRNQIVLQKAIDDAFSQLREIDVVIHNACRCTFDAIENTDIDTYRDVLDVNYFGALRLTKAVLPYLKKQKCGKIIYTSSGVGVTGFVNISPYASSKGALESLAKCLNIECARDQISFHIIHPPLTRTKSSQPLPIPKEFMAAPEKVGRGLAKHIFSKRFIICNSFSQKLQTMACYAFPVKMGRLLSKMTVRYESSEQIRKD